MQQKQKPILDVACGGKMFYFDKNDPRVLFCDKRELHTTLCDGRPFEIKPDIIADFTQLPFDDNTFKMVVFDPPHLLHNETSPITGYQQIKYGALCGDWREMLTNYDTTIEEDLYRVKMIDESGFIPDVRIYRKPTAPRVVKDLQRWCNNRIIPGSCDFMDYIPRADGRTIRQLYFGGKK